MLERYLKIYKALSVVILQYSIIILLPLVFCIFYPYEVHNVSGFLLAALLGFLIYLSGFLTKIRDIGTITYKDGAVLTVVAWAVVSFISAIPHMVNGGLNFSQAMFESVSGLSTTGLTMYTDVTKVSKLLLFWRSLTQYVGGAGFALLMLATVIGPRGLGFYRAEGRAENLVPNIRRSSQIILGIYLSYTVAGTIALKIAGMNLFEALNHTMTALATGGFSTRNGSIGEFNSLTIEIIIMVLMYLGATGFGIHYAFWKRNWKAVLKNGEPWIFNITIISTSIIITFVGLGKYYKGFWEGFRIVVFQIISGITGTGFQTVTLADPKWLSFYPFMFMLTVLMIAGGEMDSTSGGIKQFRFWVIFNALWDSIMGFLLPKGTVRKRVLYKGEQQITFSDDNVREALLIFSLYVFSFILGSVVLMCHGYSVEASMFEFASAMDGVGLTAGVTTPNMPLTALWDLIIGMFAGRLEFLVIIYALARIFSDVKNSLTKSRNPISKKV